MSKALETAIAWAALAHAGQTDKSSKPYILHPLRVMILVSDCGEDAMITAVLHDVFEDTPYKLEEIIRRGYSTQIQEALVILTRNYKQSYDDYIRDIKSNALAKIVKLADLRDNKDPLRLDAIKHEPTRDRLKAKYTRAQDILLGKI